ncbi:MAG: glycosyltransferase [Nitrospirae bacterium]|nr:glycosyltransferase [Nitrospirota bacterium]
MTVIIPTRNEGRFIADCLDSVLTGEYPVDRLEILVIDALSTDETRDVINTRKARGVPIRILDDTDGNLPRALNLAIRESRGEILIRLDAHNTYAKDYLRRCVGRLVAGEAEIVGGVWHAVPRTPGAWGRAVTAALSEPFGVGNAHYRTRRLTQPTLVDTVPYFACQRALFDRFGFFDDSIPGSEDMVYNSHLRESGGRILLDPAIESWYQARTEFGSFVKHNLRNGYWAMLPLHWGVRFRARHFAPLVFVSAMAVLGVMWLLQQRFGWLFVVALVTYVLVAAGVALRAAVRERAPMQFALMPVVFSVLHVSYGIGSVAGICVLIWRMFGTAVLTSRKS